MNKFLNIFLHEYTRQILRKRFLFALLSLPLLIGVLMAVSIAAAIRSIDTSPVGYVDQSGLLAQPISLPPSNDFFSPQVNFLAFRDESEAKSALHTRTIQAYYVLPPDYRTSGNARLIYLKAPDSSVQNLFLDFLKLNVLSNQPADISSRILDGPQYTYLSADGQRSIVASQWYNILVPVVAGALFLMVILTSGGYLLRAVVEEKENRTIEIIVTSVSPDQLMAGKIVGNISVGVTQILVWTIFIGIFFLIGRNHFEWIQNLQLNSSLVLLMLLTLIPSFVMVASLMAAIGSSTTESREAEQISGIFSLPITVPLFLIMPIISNPNSPLAIFLSFFPLTASVTLPLRAAFTQIPVGQEIANLSILVIFAGAAVWLAARTFHLGLLRYGKRLSLREIFLGETNQ